MEEKNILVISDLHDSHSGLEKLKKWTKSEKVDLVLGAGDLTSTPNPYQIETFKKIISILGEKIPFFTIAGNNEKEETINWLRKKGILLEKKNFFGFKFLGISGWGEDTQILSKESLDDKTILISHVPPIVFPRGRIKIEDFKNCPKIHLFGHLHQEFFEKIIGNTRAIHIPPLLFGNALILTIPSFKIKILE